MVEMFDFVLDHDVSWLCDVCGLADRVDIW